MKYFLIIIMCLSTNIYALAAQSIFSDFDFQKICTYDDDAQEITKATCKIDGKPDIYFLECDLHQALGFGAPKAFENFGAKNNMHNVIEWRSDKGVISAAIVRFFINKPDSTTFEVTPESRGQILVIHRFAQTIDDATCVVGLVDARANDDANRIARKVADDMAVKFDCATDVPLYYGQQSRHTANFYKKMSDFK